MQIERVPFTTAADGSATVYSGVVNGKLNSVFYDYGDAATGADFTITGETSGIALLTITNAGTSDILWLPRDVVCGLTGSDIATTYEDAKVPIFGERIKIVVAQGGDTKTGALYFAVDT